MKKTEITIEQKARVFSMYHGCKVTKRNSLFGYERTLSHIILDGKSVDLHEVLTWDWVLLLRPLSAISDEDAIEVARFYSPKSFDHKVRRDYPTCVCVDYLDPVFNTLYIENDSSGLDNRNAFQYLISKGYSVPLLCLNGQDPITAGLAIDATKS